jgi:antagonist of KipI
MDNGSLRLANVLVGNEENAAGVEIAWHGFACTFADPTLVAIAGADLQPTFGGVALPNFRPVRLPPGAALRFSHPKAGCFAYLAVAGGLQSRQIMGSRSAYARSSLRAVAEGPLQAGDELPIGQLTGTSQAIAAMLQAAGSARRGRLQAFSQESHANLSFGPPESAAWFFDGGSTTPIGRTIELATLRGRHFEILDARSQRLFWSAEFIVSQVSDRMGYRLEGPELRFAERANIASAPVCRGTIQLPDQGSPIALMAESATTGGYPNIAHVADAECGRLAQAQPGQSIRFREIDLAAARQLAVAQAECFRRLRRAISLRAQLGAH